MTSALDDKLASALALAIAQKPRANLQQIARTAGISKATLYRISPTREGVVEMLKERCNRHMQDALTGASLESEPFHSALERLTEGVMKERAFYLFWNAALWMDLNDVKNDQVLGYGTSFYSDALEKFFLKGQKAGVFRVDMPARWLAKAYDFLLYAAVESAQRGEIAPVGMSIMVDKMFLDGALSESAR